MRMRSGYGPALVALGVIATLSACAADVSTPRELKFGHVGEPGSLFALSADEFARRANARLPEGWEVVTYGSSQLGGDELLLQKIKLGTVDFALPSTIMSSQVDEFGLFEMPYLVRDREHMRSIEEAVVWPELVPLADAAGYRIIAVWENVTNNRRPIVTPADLAGVKLRTPSGVWRLKLFQGLGANPTPMALSEVFIGLQTGVIDGQENPLAQIWGSKLYEVQEYLSLTGHVYTPAYVVVSPSRWAGLPDDVVARARELLVELEGTHTHGGEGLGRHGAHRPRSEAPPDQLSMFQVEHPVVERLRKLDPDALSPREALDLLYELGRDVKRDG